MKGKFDPNMKERMCGKLKKTTDETSALQGTNISHLGKRKIISTVPLKGDMLVARRVYTNNKPINYLNKLVPTSFSGPPLFETNATL